MPMWVSILNSHTSICRHARGISSAAAAVIIAGPSLLMLRRHFPTRQATNLLAKITTPMP